MSLTSWLQKMHSQSEDHKILYWLFKVINLPRAALIHLLDVHSPKIYVTSHP